LPRWKKNLLSFIAATCSHFKISLFKPLLLTSFADCKKESAAEMRSLLRSESVRWGGNNASSFHRTRLA